MPGNIKNVMAAIDYIENHLHEKLDLETVAGAVHYSKYHLHRMFTNTAGLTVLIKWWWRFMPMIPATQFIAIV